MAVLTVLQNGKELKAPFEGAPLVCEVLEGAGIFAPHPCGKKGICKKCNAFFINSDGTFEGLTCNTVITNDTTVILKDNKPIQQIAKGNKQFFTPIAPYCEGYGAAIDIGTTTVVLNLCDIENGKVIYTCAKLNSQSAVASDVMGRIDAALTGKAHILKEQVISDINELLENACNKCNISICDVKGLVITGNTTMMYLLTEKNPKSIATAPFDADELFGYETTVLGKKAYIPPCMNAFVGADVTCAVLSSGMCNENINLLCDLGTNGEVALWKNKKLYVTSTAAGPAFEGVGISCGCQSIEGAIDKVAINNGKVEIHTINDCTPVGICGSGLIDAVSTYLDFEIIDETGAVDNDISLCKNVTVTGRDIRQFQLAKAAICAGILTVISKSNIKPEDIKNLYIAGGFGAHININSAINTGLIPKEFKNKELILGNASLAGATELIFNRNLISELEVLASNSEHINIGGDELFNNNYIEQMMFERQ